jgi:hypothetical protein
MDSIISTIANNIYLPNVEIEARLGSINLNKFDSSVDETIWNRILNVLGAWNGWEKVETTKKEIYINDSIKKNYRTVVNSCGDDIFEKKEKLVNNNYSCKNSPWDVRFSVSQEFKLSTKIVLNPDHPSTLTRIKTTKSFYHKFWRYDLSVITQKINNCEKKLYELEIELWNMKDAIKAQPIYLAKDLICKIQDIINIVEKTNKPVELIKN